MFSFRGRTKTMEERGDACFIRGSMHRAIVMKSPDDAFAEAVFILKDGFLQGEGVSKKELLRQAAEAASVYCPKPKKANPGLSPLLLFLLGAATAIVLVWVFGLAGILV